MTNEYQEIKSIVDAGYRLVVYPYCFLIVSGVGKIHILRQQDNPRRWDTVSFNNIVGMA